MALKGNKGEWSEIYALFKLLADGKLYAADENLNRIDGIFIPIIKIVREEIRECNEFYTGANIRVQLCDGSVVNVPTAVFSEQADYLLDKIKAVKGSSFSIPETEQFMHTVNIERVKSLERGKSDIVMKIHDIQSSCEPEVGFSIKSRIGSGATLLNACAPTNFVFEIYGSSDLIKNIQNNIENIQGVEKPTPENKSIPIRDILSKIYSMGVKLRLDTIDKRFYDNLIMIDSEMPRILASMLETFYSKKVNRTNITSVVNYISKENILDSTHSNLVNYYSYKVKNLLCAVALGMTPTAKWNGEDDVIGGYIVVKADGDVVAYHIYNRERFRTYLYNSTKMEAPQRFDSLPPSKKKGFDYGYIYEDDGRLFIKLNLQIRFK